MREYSLFCNRHENGRRKKTQRVKAGCNLFGAALREVKRGGRELIEHLVPPRGPVWQVGLTLREVGRLVAGPCHAGYP